MTAANAAEEAAKAGKGLDVPYWRTLKAGGFLNEKYPGGVVPDNTPLHPTPVYEMILGIVGFIVLWQIRKRSLADGKIWCLYLMLASLFRFGIEFLRLKSAKQFEPMPGRVMREYVVVPKVLLNAPEQLRAWVEKSLTYVSSLPAKPKRSAGGGKKPRSPKR
jgi:prolipoprotein diacylglyceryltransferase